MPVVLAIRPGDPDHKFRAVLDSEEYQFRARWNSRMNLWTLDAADRSGTQVFEGAVIVLGAIIGRTASHKLTQEGIIVARDTTRSGTEAGFDDITTRVEVRYYTLDEAQQEIIGDLLGT